MKRAIAHCVVLAGVCGCDALNIILDPRVTVTLVNASDYPVDVTMFVSDDQEILESLLVDEGVGEKLLYTLAAGQTVSFSRPCDELQAMIIEQAELNVALGLGPEANTDVLRDGDDFSCGDEVVFTFDHSAQILDFDVTVTVR